mmetsp:Transcript_61883/g.192201  ORF Transcript_61883/g.192201 Transcript_61883/m.192201 type:complete len:236 (+) Transcript_61883:692-1399(+)
MRIRCRNSTKLTSCKPSSWPKRIGDSSPPASLWIPQRFITLPQPAPCARCFLGPRAALRFAFMMRPDNVFSARPALACPQPQATRSLATSAGSSTPDSSVSYFRKSWWSSMRSDRNSSSTSSVSLSALARPRSRARRAPVRRSWASWKSFSNRSKRAPKLRLFMEAVDWGCASGTLRLKTVLRSRTAGFRGFAGSGWARSALKSPKSCNTSCHSSSPTGPQLPKASRHACSCPRS